MTGFIEDLDKINSRNGTNTRRLRLHAFPFYKKRSYKKRPIKFFNHKKQ